MSRVFVDLGLSLDGFVAGQNRGPGNPLGDGGLAIHDWMFATATFRERRCGDPGDGERGPDDDAVAQGFARSGAWVIGRRMFDEGEASWPEDAPFRAPVFVVTRHARAPWVRGGTTFHFVTDGLLAALTRAREAAGARDVRIGGGADLVQQAFAAGVVDELTLHVAPVLLGRGLRLFDGVPPGDLVLEPNGAAVSPRAQHLHFRVRRAAG
ncbi:MAG: dihydrofolate reductase family protein [Planctomycetes bacterium]|nr:dihydrofolate reductase family protein [Planctomycetota bacterium]